MSFEFVTSSRPATNRYDLVVVGGGIVGLATAREFLRRQPRLRLAVLEKEPELASHQSGHNSGVIHTGIYYAPGSLKARACVEGHRLMIEFCRERGIPFELSGKVIVAVDESELARLEELYWRGTANGVQGLEIIGPERLREIEPHAAGIRAIWSPTTGIVDYKQVAGAYAAEIDERGGELVTGCQVVSLQTTGPNSRLSLETATGQVEIESRYVVTCGGLYSDKLVRLGKNQLPDQYGNQPQNQPEAQIVPFRGDYYKLVPEKSYLVRSMIYPVPDPEFPFLGVHFTRKINGEVWAGPNAVLAFAREGYGRWQIRPGELAESLAYPGFRRLALKYWKTGLAEMYRDYFKGAYVRALQRYLPAVRNEDLLAAPGGVRAQALAPDGRLVDDFLIKAGSQVVHVQNAPSPAATSSLVIARTIVEEAARSFELSLSQI